MKAKQRTGFSLIEMVIVILILGIIAAVAAPRMFDTAARAEESTTRQQLGVLRNAIEMYRASYNSYPLSGELKARMEEMLNGPFPAPTIGTNKGQASVYNDADTNEATPAAAAVAQPHGWVYKPINGSLKLNVGAAETGYEW
ncbi:MAG: prepilin-type N-terminal cleavage/methylation domain-containing protein [Planctomycetota bacterium]